ncbi:VanZ family protein [Phenylobacterium sp.]|uniref:VanZ family protein n=1 Tax=Phenylobacterium sp. TaxID=1871053 RepID=UPI00122983C8|nr:VanZ family protein [Phenylobacterium sp.]THD51509.1 MAG: VanZ family protein [Phenylobacterium sp.]
MTPFEHLRRLPRPVRLAIYGLACAILLYITLAPGKYVPGVGVIWDKAEHASAWAVLTGAGLLLSTKRRWAILLFAFIFGATIEVLQAVLPFGRDGDILDLTADTVGIAAAYAVWLIWRRLGWVK